MLIGKLLVLLAAAPLALGGVGTAARGPATSTCEGLTAAHVQAGIVTAAATVDGYCQVRGVLLPATHFTVELPVSGWTGEYVQQGCSGLCGAVPDLTFPLFGFTCPAAKAKTLVVAGDDAGHTGDAAGAQPATWGADPRARLEWGLTSEHRLRLASDALTTAYYGHGPTYRYFDGCSTGGRQGLNLAQRFPADFDGILAGAPARFTRETFDRLNLVGNALYNANDPDLSAFRARGGKLIMYHGWADPSIPPFSTVDYYRAVQQRGGANRYTRLYMIPAGYHCLFGPEVDSPSEIGVPEFLQPLMDWVERDAAPGVINVPTVDSDVTEVIRDVDVAPFDALAPVQAAPGSLNADYHYVGRY